MTIDELKNVIKKTIKGELCVNSLLIDGSWGCGKTTIIKETIEDLLNSNELENKKIIYQSLFGIKDINELSACFSKIGRAIYSVGKSIAGPFTKLVPFVGDQIYESINNTALLFNGKQKAKKNAIFVFDDLERVDPSFSYTTLLGFFNQLIMRGSIIICISSLNNLSEIDIDNKRDRELATFIEKSFDKVIRIDGIASETIPVIFKDLKDFNNINSIHMSMFEDNLRTAIKTSRLLQELEKKDGFGDLKKKYGKPMIFKGAICAIRSVYLTNFEIANKQTKNIINFNINKRIAEEINKNKNFYLEGEREIVRELAECFCQIDVCCSDTIFQKLLELPSETETKDKNTQRGTIRSIYFLSDNDKRIALNKYKNELKDGKLKINRYYIDKLVDVVKYSDFDLKKEGLYDLVVNNIASDATKNQNSDVFNRLKDYTQHPFLDDSKRAKTLMTSICNDVSQKYEEYKLDELQTSINNFLKENNFGALLDLAYSVEKHKEPETVRNAFDRLLKDNGFYLPDLSKTITEDQWGYSHEIARYVSDNEQLKEAFFNALKNMLIQNKSSKTLKDRIDALLRYNFSANEVNVLKEYLNN